MIHEKIIQRLDKTYKLIIDTEDWSEKLQVMENDTYIDCKFNHFEHGITPANPNYIFSSPSIWFYSTTFVFSEEVHDFKLEIWVNMMPKFKTII